MLLDLGDSAISLLRVRDIVAWTLEARARSIKVVIIGKVWHRAALSSLTRHDMPGQDLPALWSNE
ncbi:hypothetical protein [Deinococcus maricopensis]|uniref:Uncharacterized protein n=1 Tax=Deinococcus maricopensis (strain DSM 21211 / LMG 22137 / NRRL B-23946 / LB-34) TaxID=709986 RepID=E8U618_DEIML|nr:hypothetical protein [Deinococcus maricopensis]ADV66507.1 hypothetical protein Deima_0852 [Deinococcus maricopensis DSM 21211]